MIDIRLFQREAEIILNGYLTEHFTPTDAARFGWTAEQYTDELWPVILAKYQQDLQPKDLELLHSALLDQVRAAMEPVATPQ
ncbi:MAG: hypothetical protein JW900_02735 [Anaerolineae bacterium]|nr:hypothetical protein [Anaerolineae bacterium]